jgi:hypothetical protein
MMDRVISSLVALTLALLVWLYARSRDQEILDNVQVPVQISLPANQADNYNLELGSTGQVVVSFTGSPMRMRELHSMLQRNDLHVEVTFPIPDERLSESRFSDTVIVESTDVHTPPGVTPMVVEGRNRIPVTLHRLVEKRLPVRFESALDEPVGQLEIDPPSVLVRGPQEVLDKVRNIATVPSTLRARPTGSAGDATSKVALVQELDNRPVRVSPNKVTVRLPAQSRKMYELQDVPVYFLCPPNFTLRPRFIDERSGKITLRLHGPVQDEPPKVYAYIELTRGSFLSGLNHEPVQLQLPKDFQLADDPPRVIAFELVPADFVPKNMGRTSPP